MLKVTGEATSDFVTPDLIGSLRWNAQAPFSAF